MHHTDEDLDQLHKLLNQIPVEDDGMELSELDGFIAGLLVCPEMIMPSEWLSLVWGGDGHGGFTDLSEVEEMTTAIMGHYNRVAKTLANAPDAYEPIFGAELNSNNLLWEPWIDGFETAMSLRPESWLQIVESGDEEASSSVTMVLAMYGIYSGETDLPDDAIDEVDRVGPDLIPNIVQTLNTWVKSRQSGPSNVVRYPSANTPASSVRPFPGKKVRRNEPCYCGSGRKYKRCCGAH